MATTPNNLTGSRSKFPVEVDTMRRLDNYTSVESELTHGDRISAGTRNKMGDAAVAIEKSLFGAPTIDNPNRDYAIASFTTTIKAMHKNVWYTLDMPDDVLSALHVTAASPLDAVARRMMVFIDARPISAQALAAWNACHTVVTPRPMYSVNGNQLSVCVYYVPDALMAAPLYAGDYIISTTLIGEI